MGGYKTKCATGLFLTQNECRKAGSILKQLTGKTYKYSKKWIFSMSTRNYGCYNKDKYIYFNTYTRGTSRTPSARSICKAGSIGGSYSWVYKPVRVFVPKSLGCSKSRDGGNWGKSFDRAGWSKCKKGNQYISGFKRSAQGWFGEDRIGRLEEARCCKASSYFSGQKCVNTNWGKSFDKKNNWNKCPKNYYLHGLKRSNGNGLHNIEIAHCCKPKNSEYGTCYTQDITRSFDRKGWSACRSGYSAVGLYRSKCDTLHCIEKIKCCQMAVNGYVAQAPKEVPKSLGCSKSRDGGDWGKSFDHAGWSKCKKGNQYISGFKRSAQGWFGEDRIGRLEEARCCKASSRFSGQKCTNANWVTSFDKKNNWNSCPKNYYLHGMKRSNGNGLHNIEWAHCCKPKNSVYGTCYTQDITRSFDRKGWSACRSGYSAVGLYRSKCDKLHCIEKIKCCQMAVTYSRWG